MNMIFDCMFLCVQQRRQRGLLSETLSQPPWRTAEKKVEEWILVLPTTLKEAVFICQNPIVERAQITSLH